MVLIDGTALAYQSFFALQNLRSPHGRPTGAVYGFHQTVESLQQEYQPTYLVVIMDQGKPTERTDLFSDYKADRAPTPTELLEQLPVIEEMMTHLGILVLSQEGIEADDILATLAQKGAEKDVKVYIYSPDKDMLQMVNDQIHVIRRHGANTKIYDQQAVLDRYGCRPEQFPDLLGLMGDSVDNIPGVPGIGEKTAGSLLSEYGSLEAVLDKANTIRKPKLKESLLTNREQAILSKELATLKVDLALGVEIDDLKPVKANWQRAAQIFRELGFKKATLFAEEQALRHAEENDLPASNGTQSPDLSTNIHSATDTERAPARFLPQSNASLFTPFPRKESDSSHDYQIIRRPDELRALVTQLQTEQPFAIDTETTGVDSYRDSLVGICFGLSGGRGWYLPVAHVNVENLPLPVIQEILGPLLADPSVGKLAHHIKYDARILERHGLSVQGWISDTMVLAHLLHSRQESLKLDNLAVVYLDRRMIPITALIGEKKATQITIDQVPLAQAAEYGAEDAEVTYALHFTLQPELESQGITEWYQEVVLPLNLVLLSMENRGVLIAPSILQKQSQEMQVIIDRVEQELYEIAGKKFNPNSPAQLAKILFEERKVPRGKSKSTRQVVLEDLAHAGEPLAAKIIEYRQAMKLKSTYLDALPELIDTRDGRLHTNYSTTVANTGRISSHKPNLQNIPIRTDLGRRIREAFIAQDGHLFVSADYSQIELRVLAHFSQDPGFIKAFHEGLDIHAFTASEVFEVGIEQVDKDMRRKAKEINFGLNYGMSAFGLASRLGISRLEARVFMDRYFSRYPNIQAYFETTLANAERDGYVTTLVGRRVEVPRPRSSTGAEARAAINAPIQGSAADILKKAMVDLDKAIKRQGMESAMVLTVHDEIILEVPEAEVDEVTALLPTVMREAIRLIVPIEVDVSVGKSWADLG